MSKSKTFRTQVWEVIYPGTVTIDQLTDSLFANAKSQYIHEAFVCTHTKGETTHTHAGISLGKKPNYTATSCYTAFTLSGIKPNKVAPLKVGKGAQGKMDVYYNYCGSQGKHEGEVLGDIVCYKFIHKEPEAYLAEKEAKQEKTSKLSPSALVLKAYVEGGKSLYDQYQDADWNQKAYITMNYEKLSGMLSAHRRMLHENKPPEFPMSSFIPSPAKKALVDHDFGHREPGKKKQAIVLKGESNLGKTKLAKARFNKPLVIRHMDKLKQFDPLRHDGLVFDDMSFAHYPRESVLSLMDMDDDADVNVKNSMVTIPAGFPRIFCTNRLMYATKDGHYDKEESFLPKPLTTMPKVDPYGPQFNFDNHGKLANGANGANGANCQISDPALTNRFTLIVVENKLYA